LFYLKRFWKYKRLWTLNRYFISMLLLKKKGSHSFLCILWTVITLKQHVVIDINFLFIAQVFFPHVFHIPTTFKKDVSFFFSKYYIRFFMFYFMITCFSYNLNNDMWFLHKIFTARLTYHIWVFVSKCRQLFDFFDFHVRHVRLTFVFFVL